MGDQAEGLERAALSVTGANHVVRAPSPPDMQRLRVMVVDDDDGFRGMIRDWLMEEGISEVAEARDGAEAVARASHARPDVILMDVRMPRMNGIEAAERIRELLPSVQVVMLSGYEDAALKRAGEAAGVHTYLVKGCPPAVLWRTIRLAGAAISLAE